MNKWAISYLLSLLLVSILLAHEYILEPIGIYIGWITFLIIPGMLFCLALNLCSFWTSAGSTIFILILNFIIYGLLVRVVLGIFDKILKLMAPKQKNKNRGEM